MFDRPLFSVLLVSSLSCTVMGGLVYTEPSVNTELPKVRSSYEICEVIPQFCRVVGPVGPAVPSEGDLAPPDCHGLDEYCWAIPNIECPNGDAIAQVSPEDFALDSGEACATQGTFNGPMTITWDYSIWTPVCSQCTNGTIFVGPRQCEIEAKHFDTIPDNRGKCAGCSLPTETLVQGPNGTFTCISDNHCAYNRAGYNLTMSYEHFCSEFYNDGTGHKAIGWGHDCCANGDCDAIAPNGEVDQETGNQVLIKDVGNAAAIINGISGLSSMNMNQYAAFVDFAYNSGYAFTKVFKKMIAAKDWDGICKAMANTTIVHPSQRRIDQSTLCSTPTNTTSGCPEKKKGAVRSLHLEEEEERKYEARLETRRAMAERRTVCHPWKGGDKNCAGKACTAKFKNKKPKCRFQTG